MASEIMKRKEDLQHTILLNQQTTCRKELIRENNQANLAGMQQNRTNGSIGA